MTKNEITFFHFICSCDQYESEMAFLFHLQVFLIKKFETDPIIVFSQGKNLKNTTEDFWRISWQKSFNGQRADIPLYRKAIEENQEKISTTYNRKLLYTFTLENCGTQIKYLVFSSSEDIGSNVIYYMKFFLNTAYKNILKFKVVGGIQDLVYLDDITGLYNQRKLHKDLDEAINNFRSYDAPFYILFLDVDHFKKINDKYGHLTGTKVLLHMANLFKETLRESDLIYRYGGDEFVIIIPNIDFQTAMRIGRRILNTVTSRRFEIFNNKNERSFKVSISVGVAGFPKDAKTKDDVLNIADKMMYKAKGHGRGQVCYAQDFFS